MKKITIYLLIITASFLVSCTEWLTIQPEDTLSKDEMFESKDGFYGALYGIYTLSEKNYGHNGELMSNTIEHMAGQWAVKSESTEEKLRSHDYTTLDTQIALIFRNQYKTIANVNLMLEYLETQDFLSDEDYKILKGECVAIRAWLHFDLIRLWGPVPDRLNEAKLYLPYVTKFGYERNKYYVYNEYMKLLTDDIEQAETLLDGMPFEADFRLNYWGLKALQARIYLWEGDNQKAYDAASEVIAYAKSTTPAVYELGTLDAIGAKQYLFPSEHVFGIYDDFEAVAFRNTLYNFTQYLNELYEYSASDIRLELWENRNVQGLEQPAMNLLKYATGSGSVSIIRLSEIYFIAMECGSLAQANTLYTEFCVARGIPQVSITTETQRNSILFKEYRKEFIGEGVLFWYYKRHMTTNIPNSGHTCTEKCYVLPLPKEEVNVNLNN